MTFASALEYFLGFFILLFSLGVIMTRKPVHACLSFLFTLLSLAALYLHLSAAFIAAMQILVYAGAILVLFMFVIILFQDAHAQLANAPGKASPFLFFMGLGAFLLSFLLLGMDAFQLTAPSKALPEGFGAVEALGRALYIEFFFPFEAVILLFLVAVVGALYIGKKVKI